MDSSDVSDGPRSGDFAVRHRTGYSSWMVPMCQMDPGVAMMLAATVHGILDSSDMLLLKCCFTSTETVGLLGTGAQDGHLDFHTAPGLYSVPFLQCCFLSMCDRRDC